MNPSVPLHQHFAAQNVKLREQLQSLASSLAEANDENAKLRKLVTEIKALCEPNHMLDADLILAKLKEFG